MRKLRHLVMLTGICTVGLLLMLAPVSAQTCADYGTCTPVPPPPDVVTEPVGPVFGDDGRLNPEPAEYYSVYCKNNVVEVLRAVPPPTSLVTSIPIQQLVSLSNGASLTVGGVTATKNGNTISLNGGGGNAGTSGPKNFSLSECISRNGPLPPPPQPNPPPAPEEEEEGSIANAPQAIIRNYTTAFNNCCPLFGLLLPFGGLGLAFRRRLRRLSKLR